MERMSTPRKTFGCLVDTYLPSFRTEWLARLGLRWTPQLEISITKLISFVGRISGMNWCFSRIKMPTHLLMGFEM
ncbi:hypothetical protein L6452_18178 [Arctium lappa]|uniref:Uncharacterized protein n=1 Tax=Arctium lappa TaxID=4217 RepID=A0ACB9C5G8_ARCLA|nr:hypothetical protein L6452_18178 [Arctium lappa]